MSKKNAIAKKEAKQEIKVYTETESMGVSEEVTSSDVQIPSIMLMQSNATLVSDRDNDIKSGDFVHSLTKKVMGSPDEPIDLCVVDMFKTQVITETEGNKWLATKQWVADMEKEEYLEVVDGKEIKRQKCYNYICFRPLDIREVKLPTGETHYVASPIVVKFKGGSSKNAKKFNQICRDLAAMKYPSWCMNYNLTAYQETNDKGTFWVYDFVDGRPALEETQKAAAMLCEMSQAARKAGTMEVIDMDEVEPTVKDVNGGVPNYAPGASNPPMSNQTPDDLF